MKMKCITFTIICSLFFSTLCYGEISGYVKDYRRDPVSGATITLTDESNPSNVYSSITDADGSYEITGLETIIDENDLSKSQAFELYQNYPNPFNPSTIIGYSLPKDGHITITIFNISGQVVCVLKNELQTSGNYSIIWNATGVPSGLYFYTLKADGFIETRKMSLVR